MKLHMKTPVLLAVLSLGLLCVIVVKMLIQRDGSSRHLLANIRNNFVWREKVGVDAEDRMVRTASTIHHNTGLVLFTMVNNAYLEFALSWLCNTASMTNVHSHVLFTCTDAHTADVISARWPHVTAVNLNMSSYSGDQVYSHVGYVGIMVERTKLILHMLEAGVRLLLFEVDCVWIQNPLPFLMEKTLTDIVATIVQERTAGGFLLLNPTRRTVGLWRTLTLQMEQLMHSLHNRSRDDVVDWHLNDQEFLSALVARKEGGIEVEHLPSSTFPDGQWYDLPAGTRNYLPRPYIINNNFVVGNKKKKERAAKWGHWFLTPSWQLQGPLCDERAVNNVLTSPDSLL